MNREEPLPNGEKCVWPFWNCTVDYIVHVQWVWHWFDAEGDGRCRRGGAVRGGVAGTAAEASGLHSSGRAPAVTWPVRRRGRESSGAADAASPNATEHQRRRHADRRHGRILLLTLQ